MRPQSVDEFRAGYRERYVSPRYSGRLHLATTTVSCLLVAGLMVAMLDDVTPLEWLTVPLTFLYANLVEYLGHKGPMHHRVPFLGLIFERHAILHHSFFTAESICYDSNRDFRAVLFPPIMLVFFLGWSALPVGALLYWLISPNVAFLFVMVAMLYFLNYELLHLAYHMDPDSWVGRLPFMDRLRTHHTYHHDRRLMGRYNFNITYPICDHLFGTDYQTAPRPESDAGV